ncbi:GTP pyrophosphokinase [Clostridium perfringens]
MKNLEELEEWHDINSPIFDNLIKKSKLIIEEAIKEEGITINSINGRVKEKKSFCNKALKDKYTDPINQIKDLGGLRIITYINSDVDKISRIIEKEFDVDKENSLDKGELLGIDKVGYKSVHYIVKLNDKRTQLTEYKKFKDLYFEIQIRTLLQHAWSEIEHDRNYKFSGKLPKEIQREFAILSGTLELVDMHFENISSKIDSYSMMVKENILENNLKEIELNSTSIKTYLDELLINEVKNDIVTPVLVDDELIDELNNFGITDMIKLKKLMDNRVICKKEYNNYIGVLRDTMMKVDCDKYFDKCWNSHWDGITVEDLEMLSKEGIDISKAIQQNLISVYN